MKLLHTVKTGKVNEIPLKDVKFVTHHKKKQGKVTHEGWAIVGKFKEKEHEYLLMFTPEEAQEFHRWLGQMLSRFKADDLTQFIHVETHEE